MSATRMRTPLSRHHAPLLSVRPAHRGATVVVEVAGELDMSSTPLLTGAVDRIAGHRPDRLVLDLAGVTFFCADGLRALLHARDTVTAAGGRFLLRAPSAPVRRVLGLVGADGLFTLDTGDARPGFGLRPARYPR